METCVACIWCHGVWMTPAPWITNIVSWRDASRVLWALRFEIFVFWCFVYLDFVLVTRLHYDIIQQSYYIYRKVRKFEIGKLVICDGFFYAWNTKFVYFCDCAKIAIYMILCWEIQSWVCVYKRWFSFICGALAFHVKCKYFISLLDISNVFKCNPANAMH